MNTFVKNITFMLVVTVLSCSEDISTYNADEVPVFSGILEVDADCQIIGGDTTDFQPRPIMVWDTLSGNIQRLKYANYSLIYACPNPAYGNMTNVVFQMGELDSVWIYLYDGMFRGPVDTIVSRTCHRGKYSVPYFNRGRPGIYRIVMHAANGFISYGDVQFNE